MDEIVYAKWDDTSYWYLAQVLSVDASEYNLHFLDGYDKQNVSEKEVRKVPAREKKNKPIGKRFYDDGDYKPGFKRKTTDFKRGEFTVLGYQAGSNGNPPSYWCERVTVGDDIMGGERDIQQFGIKYVSDLIDEYDNE